jgi:uncharacterized protein
VSPQLGLPPTKAAADQIFVSFARALRAAGVTVTQDRTQSYLSALALLDLAQVHQVQVAGRATLCSSPDERERHDQVFEEFFRQQTGLPRELAKPLEKVRAVPLGGSNGQGKSTNGAADRDDDEVLRVAASDVDRLRHRDIAGMTPAEKVLLARMLGTLQIRLPRRKAHRHQPWRRGVVDSRRTLRATLRHFGEPAQVHWRHPGDRPRRVVFLLDVSGSMESYAEALLRLAHRYVVTDRAVEVFTVGTRLTRITRALRHRDPERALHVAGQVVSDWSGGTRLGESLKVFLDRWGQGGLARGAVVVIFSDGWERGNAQLLADQMLRLHHLSCQVIWVNPHQGRPGYQPLQQGILAALPSIDHLLAGHSLATYRELSKVVADA